MREERTEMVKQSKEYWESQAMLSMGIWILGMQPQPVHLLKLVIANKLSSRWIRGVNSPLSKFEIWFIDCYSALPTQMAVINITEGEMATKQIPSLYVVVNFLRSE
jgi:hypothetical protein